MYPLLRWRRHGTPLQTWLLPRIRHLPHEVEWMPPGHVTGQGAVPDVAGWCVGSDGVEQPPCPDSEIRCHCHYPRMRHPPWRGWWWPHPSPPPRQHSSPPLGSSPHSNIIRLKKNLNTSSCRPSSMNHFWFCWVHTYFHSYIVVSFYNNWTTTTRQIGTKTSKCSSNCTNHWR